LRKTLSSIVISAVLVLSGGALAHAQGAESPSNVIRVESTSHVIDFPNEVTLRLNVQADAPITSVRLLYDLGPDTVTTYGYPSFESSPEITASFVIPTSGSSYIPSGTEIAYRYVIEDALGNRIESDTRVVEYLDPAFDWDRYQSGDLIVLTHDRRESDVARVAEEVNAKIAEVKSLLGLEETKPVKAVIFNGSRESSKAFPRISQTASDNHLFGGFAFGQYDTFMLGGLNADGMTHESVHLLIDEAARSPFAEVPSWLNEGLAMYFESGSHRRQATVDNAARSDRLLPIGAMDRVPGRPEEIGIFYAQSWSFVNYLMSSHGTERMSEMLALIRDGVDAPDAASQAYGKSLTQLDYDWRLSIASNAQISGIADPGTVGTSALIAGAVAVTIAVSLVRWIRGSHAEPDPLEASE
jgi:hypothetical protein